MLPMTEDRKSKVENRRPVVSTAESSNLESRNSKLALYRALYRIRRFEETVLENFPKGVFYGTTHTYLGQEANAVGVLAHLQPGDAVISNHRCHGHFLAYGGEPRGLFAELMGKATGVCGGRGGSQHLHWRNFYSNGILGGTAPLATGIALAEKHKQSGAIAILFLGDGALGQGVVYESLNLAALWAAPVLFVLENNHIAQTTPTELALAGDIPARFAAFGIPARQLDTSDVCEILPLAGELVQAVRETRSPRGLILHTHRFGPHSKGDDTRPPEQVARLRQTRDPVRIHAARLDPHTRARIESEVEAEIATAFQQAHHDPEADHPQHPILNSQFTIPNPSTSLRASPHPSTTSGLRPPSAQDATHNSQFTIHNYPLPIPHPSTVLQALNTALHRAFAADERVHLIGEDLLDPYGGAFKVARGLSSAYPDRVHTSPISEAAIVGVAAGMALRGLLPVVEIMFGDFTTLIADQVINHLAKFRFMYHDQVRLPVVIRTPMGGRRGYGATHSQTLEKIFLGTPGLRVLAPTALGDPGGLLLAAILDDPDPVLFIENKLLYLEKLWQAEESPDFTLAAAGEPYPTYTLTLRDAPPAGITLAAYGYMATLAQQAMRQLAYEHEIFSELIVPIQLAPFEDNALLASLRRTRRLLVIEEGTLSFGWGAEVAARAVEKHSLHAVRRLAAADTPLPAAIPLEKAALPGVEDIVQAVLLAMR